MVVSFSFESPTNQTVSSWFSNSATTFQTIPARIFEEYSVIGRRIFRAEHGAFNIARPGADNCGGDTVYLLRAIRPERNSGRVWHVGWIFNQTDEFGFRMIPHRVVG